MHYPRNLPRRARTLLACMAIAVVLVPTPAAAEMNVGRAIVDVLVVRPLTLVQTIVGTAFFVPAVLFTPFTERGWRGPYEVFIETPGRDLIQRPLGDI